MSSCEIFVRLYQQGKHDTIKDHWSHLGKDVVAMGRVYMDACRMMEDEGEVDEKQVSLVYDVIGMLLMEGWPYRWSYVRFWGVTK